MAEYVNVMEQKRIMCNSYALCCMGCPLNDIAFCNKNSGEKTNADFPEVERRVMSWASEHPEPVYPTWGDWFAERGDLIKLWRHIRVCSEHGPGVIGFLYDPIPADIAQKLGIEPKEG